MASVFSMKSYADIVSDISLIRQGSTYCFKIMTDESTLSYSGVFKQKPSDTNTAEMLSIYLGIWVAISTLSPPKGSLIRVFLDNKTCIEVAARRNHRLGKFIGRTIDQLSRQGITISILNAYESTDKWIKPAHSLCHNRARRLMRGRFRNARQHYLPPQPVILRTDYKYLNN